MNERLHWIDRLRGMLMIAILWFHTEFYYIGHCVIPYNMYVPDVLITFFIISGFLFSCKGFQLRYKLRAILKSLLLPYFIFTVLLALPKILLNYNDTEPVTALTDILTGRASWFVSTLITAEIIFAFTLYIGSGKRWITPALCTLWFVGSLCFNEENAVYHLDMNNLWNFQGALFVQPFLLLGYELWHHRHVMHTINRPLYIIIALILFILIKIYVYDTPHYEMLIAPIRVTNVVLFGAESLAFALLMAALSRKMPRTKWTEWVGIHSLIYYFICGATPAAVAAVLNRIGLAYNQQYAMLAAAVVIVCLTATASTYVMVYIKDLLLKAMGSAQR
ncbi:MAG: hypothetical protein IJ710_03455 [Prevotella sp.]|nr:hypothetical protein [Prevotella sp.]